MTKDDFIAGLQNYLDAFGEFCTSRNIVLDNISLDHVCYKCESREEYEILRGLFELDDRFVYQSVISKRRIAYIGFVKPLTSVCGDVYYLELSDQKPDKSQVQGCDHIEPIPNGISYEEMLTRFSLPDLVVSESIKPHHVTHDIKLPNGVKLKLSEGRLVDKIYKDELVIK